MGKSGYVNTPTAGWFDEQPLGASFAFVPGEYSLFQNEHSIQFYNARAGITSFFEINLSVAYRREQAEVNKLGIGDRHLDFRFRLFKETSYFPSVVLGWTPPGSVAPFLSHDYLVLSKNFESQIGIFNISGGFGSPFVILKDPDKDDFFYFEIARKNEFFGSDYLSGLFAGFSYQPVHFGGVMLEYDSEFINAGAYIKPWEWLNLQAYTYEGNEWGFSAALNVSLKFSPKSLRRYAKDLD